jgi:hypothetical protein
VDDRALEIDGPNVPGLDARQVVLGPMHPPDDQPERVQPAPPAVLWQGNVLADSRPQRTYYVVVYVDGTGRCSCPDYYFRAVLKDLRDYACKHIRRARAQRAG